MCKYYAGAEDKAFEKRLKLLFTKIHREKPSSSRSVSSTAISQIACAEYTNRRQKRPTLLVLDARLMRTGKRYSKT